jgi:hypothetical protein
MAFWEPAPAAATGKVPQTEKKNGKHLLTPPTSLEMFRDCSDVASLLNQFRLVADRGASNVTLARD